MPHKRRRRIDGRTADLTSSRPLLEAIATVASARATRDPAPSSEDTSIPAATRRRNLRTVLNPRTATSAETVQGPAWLTRSYAADYERSPVRKLVGNHSPESPSSTRETLFKPLESFEATATSKVKTMTPRVGLQALWYLQRRYTS